jgi:hypothetical protein
MQKKLVKKGSNVPKTQEVAQNYQQRLLKIRLGNSWVQNKVKAAYYLERCNMIAGEIERARKNEVGVIRELVDGIHKTVSYAEAEYALFKISAMTCARQSYFDRQDLVKAGCSDGDLKAIEDEYLLKPIKRDEYDEEFRRERQNGFAQ